MAKLMLLIGNVIALLGAWLGGIGIGDVLLVLAFESVVSLYLLWPLVCAHRDATRLRGHFAIRSGEDGTEHCYALTYGPTRGFGHTLLVFAGLAAGAAYLTGEWQPTTELLAVLGLSLAASVGGFVVERQTAGARSMAWIRSQARATGLRIAGLMVAAPIAWLFYEMGFVCVLIMVGAKSTVELGLLTILDKMRSGDGRSLGAGLSSRSKRELGELTRELGTLASREDETLDADTHARLLREGMGNMGIAQ